MDIDGRPLETVCSAGGEGGHRIRVPAEVGLAGALARVRAFDDQGGSRGGAFLVELEVDAVAGGELQIAGPDGDLFTTGHVVAVVAGHVLNGCIADRHLPASAIERARAGSGGVRNVGDGLRG